MKYYITDKRITLELDRELAQCICWAISLGIGEADTVDIDLNLDQTKGLEEFSASLWKVIS